MTLNMCNKVLSTKQNLIPEICKQTDFRLCKSSEYFQNKVSKFSLFFISSNFIGIPKFTHKLLNIFEIDVIRYLTENLIWVK